MKSDKSIRDQIIELFQANNIWHELLHHAPARTSDEAADIRGTSKEIAVKAMLCRCKDGYWLVVFPAARKVDWRKVKNLLHLKDVSLVDPEDAEQITGVQMGSVPPLGGLFGVRVIFDPAILENETVVFNIGDRSVSAFVKSADLYKLIQPTHTESITKI